MNKNDSFYFKIHHIVKSYTQRNSNYSVIIVHLKLFVVVVNPASAVHGGG